MVNMANVRRNQTAGTGQPSGYQGEPDEEADRAGRTSAGQTAEAAFMKSTLWFKRGVARVRREWRAGRNERALAEVSRLLVEWPDNPQLLIMWADLVQLQESDEGPSLAQAKAAYQRALDLDENSSEVLNELGLFLYAVEDYAKAALPYFERAADLCAVNLERALLAKAEACAELEQWSEAAAALRIVHRLQSAHGKSSNGRNGAELVHRAKALQRTIKTALKPTKVK
jgi:Tfp pilus assembly protein PilF